MDRTVLRRRATPAVALLVGVLTVLAGCSPEADRPVVGAPRATPTVSPSPVPATSVAPDPVLSSSAAAVTTAYCDRLLPAADVVGLAGAPMGEPMVVQIGTVQGCTWQPTDDSQVSVQVVNTSSSTWGLALPQVAASVRSAGVSLDAETQADLSTTAAAVAQGAEPDADLACAIFSDIADAQGYGADRDATLTAVPGDAAPTQLVGEACSSDEYTLVQVTGPDLAQGAADRLTRIGAVLQQVHGSPLTVGTLG